MLVYKVDRLTRALADFARIIEVFDAQGVSFVSITQHLNTTTSMGRLTLNVLLSFAQFEREVTGERIRDKVAAARAKGLWMGGHVPLGYHSEHKRLVVDPAEAATVRLIFERYLALGSVARLKAELDARGVVSTSRTSLTGRRGGGKPFSRGALYRLLANRVYLGEAVHKGKAYPGEHQPIVDPARFAAVQDRLAAQGRARSHGLRAAAPSLLGGLLFDHAGAPMSPSHAVKNHKRYRYYTSQIQLQERRRAVRTMRVPAHEIEALVRAELAALLRDPGALLDLLAGAAPELAEQAALLAAAADLAGRWPSLGPGELSAVVRAVIAKVVIRADLVDIEIAPDALRRLLDPDPEPSLPANPRSGEPIVLTVPAQLRRCGGESKLIVPGRATDRVPARPNPALIKALARAHAGSEQLRSGTPAGLCTGPRQSPPARLPRPRHHRSHPRRDPAPRPHPRQALPALAARLDRAAPRPRLPFRRPLQPRPDPGALVRAAPRCRRNLGPRRAARRARKPMAMNPELRYWQAVLHAAEAELDAATTLSDLKRAARRLMRARRHLATLLAQHSAAHRAKPLTHRRRRPP